MGISYKDLNPPQQEAVFATEGPLLILAGAGSGKTRTLTCRVAYLLEQGISPWNILAITFTNKAAQEMKERVVDSAPEGDQVWVATFHSTCLRMLRRDADRLGYGSDFSIYDTEDSRVLMRRIIRELDMDPKQYREREVLRSISSLKNRSISAGDYEASAANYRERQQARLFTEYQRRLLLANAMDFDDMLGNTVRLLEENPDLLAYWQHRFRYIMVDEYQDTNPVQFRFVELLAKEHRNLCVVGDDDQSIYRFRGAEIRNILDFEKVFPEAKVIRLEQNYRSTKNILAAANGVIAHNVQRKEKTLWSDRAQGDLPAWREYDEARDEARGIVRDIMEQRARYPYGSCAVLYRTNAQSRLLEEALVSAGVPYRLIGGVNFYERREIKDTLAYLRLLVNPRDDVSLRRIINVPRRGIGDSTMEKFMIWARQQDICLYEALLRADELPEAARAQSKIRSFIQLIEGLKHEAGQLSVEALIERVLNACGYYESLKEEDPIEAEARRENLDELINKAADFDESPGLETLAAFLADTALISDVDALIEGDDYVTLMTLHSAKGLEFPKVYMAGMEQQLFPGEKAMYSGDSTDLEEERRLCYVGITRAMDKLILTGAGRRMVNGQFQQHLKSQFIEEIPSEYLKEERVGQMLSRRQYEERRDREDYLNGQNRFGFKGRPDSPFPDYESGDAPYGSRFGKSGGRAAGASASFTPSGSLADFFERAAAEKAKKKSEVLTSFTAGDRVVTKRFGAGTVVQAEARRNDQAVTVDFDKFGRKTLMASYAEFTKEE